MSAMRGVVVCPQPLAAEIGADILADGGNAFDAAIAAAFAQIVTDPHMCGLGGFGAATYATPDECQHLAFHARTGARASADMWAIDCRGRLDLGGYTLFDDHRSTLGHRSVGTPGTVAGLAALHRHARLPWRELLAPAADLARNGFSAPGYMFEMLSRVSAPGLPGALERMAYTPDSAALWCRAAGGLKQAGDHWSSPGLAATLDRLATAGPDDFYRGELAGEIAAELERGGGYVTLDDLGGYRARLCPPVEGWFRGLRVCSSTPPGGGVTLVQMLPILDRFPPAVAGEPETYAMLAEAMRLAFAERMRSVADPEFVPVPLVSRSTAPWTTWIRSPGARIRSRPARPGCRRWRRRPCSMAGCPAHQRLPRDQCHRDVRVPGDRGRRRFRDEPG